ncbi:MAG TPA: hypothetical protein VEQ34_04480 [Pyrinomonadaceae bacterium]|nr:hypothetical protein [Pyrinomonadaceae bacterium]
MKYDWEFFENFLDNIEDYSDEEFLEIMPLFVEFMRTNQQLMGFTDEQINDAANHLAEFAEKYEDARRAERELEMANKKVEQSLDNLEEALVDAMEHNGGKPVPMFVNLPPKKKKYDSN